MWFLGLCCGVGLVGLILVDCFETILQPRRVTHRFRFARLFYRSAWIFWRSAALRISAGKRREAFLSIFGPLSLLALFGIWVLGLISGFALLHWSIGSPLEPMHEPHTYSAYLYLSGTTFFTLGYGDLTPTAAAGRALAIVESGLGFGFLAVIISYLPVLSQASSRREVTISLMDARAGSPPSAAQMLLRQARSGDIDGIRSVLEEWERWAGELLESHLSFPLLSYYRSQHDNQSWLATLTTILDTCALLMVEIKSNTLWQSQLTFAMARHAAVDLALILKTPPLSPTEDRLPAERLGRIREAFQRAGMVLNESPAVPLKLNELRGMYEPFVNALGNRFLVAIPAILPDKSSPDNWQRSAWMRQTPDICSLPVSSVDSDHFE